MTRPLWPSVLPDLVAEYPDQCGWSWNCRARRYSAAIETMAHDMAGPPSERYCPDCGAGSARTAKGIARLDYRAGTAREIALDMTGNLDAPL
jgi:hypothetical protein